MKFQGTDTYVATRDLTLAVNAAIALQRPLLIKGEPGTGKTLLAEEVARALGMPLFQWHVKSTTKAQQGLYEYDAVSRLRDSQLGDPRVEDISHYIVHGVLWQAFECDEPSVVLIDEIDKAEPEVANDLLEPFDVGGFTVAETRFPVTRRRDVFLVVTTNDERDLPGAFLRRCIVHEIRRPGAEALAAIARAHFDDTVARDTALAVAQRLDVLAAQARARRLREPGVAEFLDALRACRDLGVAPGSDEWEPVTRLALWKHRRGDDGGDAP